MSRLGIRHRYTAPVINPPPDPELAAIRPFPATAPQNLDIDWAAATRSAKEHTLAQYCPNLGYVDVAVNEFGSCAGFYRFRQGQEADWPLWTVTVTVASPRTISIHMPDYIQNHVGNQQSDDNTICLWYKNTATGVDEVWDFYNFPIQASIDYTNRRVSVQAAWKLNGSTDSGWSPGTYPSKVGSRAAGCHASLGSLTADDIRFAQVNGYFPHAMVVIGPSAVWADTPLGSPLFPATNLDSHHATSYVGRTPMGRLWGLPPEFVVPASWSPEGKWMAETWKRKGAYTVDSTGGLTLTANRGNHIDPVTSAMLGGLISNRELTTIFTNSVGVRGGKNLSMVHHA